MVMMKGVTTNTALMVFSIIFILALGLLLVNNVTKKAEETRTNLFSPGVQKNFDIYNTSEPELTYENGQFHFSVEAKTREGRRIDLIVIIEAIDYSNLENYVCNIKKIDNFLEGDIEISLVAEKKDYVVKVSFWDDSDCLERVYESFKSNGCSKETSALDIGLTCGESFLGQVKQTFSTDE